VSGVEHSDFVCATPSEPEGKLEFSWPVAPAPEDARIREAFADQENPVIAGITYGNAAVGKACGSHDSAQ
jgi:hypothetical protein